MSVLKEVFCASVIYLYIASRFIKAEFSAVSKIWRAINSPKYKGINENYIHVITESVLPLVGVLGIFTLRNHARMSENGSADVPRLPQIPEDARWQNTRCTIFC